MHCPYTEQLRTEKITEQIFLKIIRWWHSDGQIRPANPQSNLHISFPQNRLRGKRGLQRWYPLPLPSPRRLIRDLQTSKSKGTVKFQPEKRTVRLSGLVYCTGIQGMQPACAFVVHYSAATLWFYISQKHMGMCTCANQQEIAVPNMLLCCTSCADFSKYSVFRGKEESVQTLFCCIGWKWNSKQATPTRNRQIHPFSSLAKNRHLPLTIDHPPVNGPVKSYSSDTAKVRSWPKFSNSYG